MFLRILFLNREHMNIFSLLENRLIKTTGIRQRKMKEPPSNPSSPANYHLCLNFGRKINLNPIELYPYSCRFTISV